MPGPQMLDVLVIAPHPDDAELGMGATIVKMLREGLAVGVLDLTDGEPTPRGSPEIRARETAAASEVLGLTWRENLGLKNRRLEATLEARARLAEVIRRTRPRWLFAPYWVDAHPDHVAATELVEATRFWAKLTKTELAGEPHYPERIFYYYCTHMRLIPQPAFIVDVSETYEQKQAALECYRSQLVEGHPPAPLRLIDRLREAAGAWGFLIGARYGEPFTCREPVGLEGFAGLK